MRALTHHGLRSVRCEEVADPVLQAPDDAIVEVELAAICGSDLHVWHGRERGLDRGTVLGHEFMGRVIAVGDEVRAMRPGTRVVAPFSTCCGACFYCARGLTARCERGALFGWVEGGRGLHGGQAGRVRVPMADATLFEVPERLAAEAALLLADVLPTGLHAARMAALRAGDVAVVLGCGPVGLMAVAAAVDAGARVLAVDRVPERLATAARFGAEPVALDDAVQVVRAATSERGADAILEVVGSEAAARLAFQLVRAGGAIAAAGVHHEAGFPFGPAEAYDRNLRFAAGRCPARSLMSEALALLARRAELAGVFTHRLPLSEGAAAYVLFDRKEDGCVKVALDPRG